MKNKMLTMVIGIALGFVLCLSAFGNKALSLSEVLNIYRDNIKLVIDGREIIPKDANGNVVEPFISGGTTYLPVRAVGEAIGYVVSYDNETKTVNLERIGSEELKIATKSYALTAGTYKIGEDIEAGYYACTHASGWGEIKILSSAYLLGGQVLYTIEPDYPFEAVGWEPVEIFTAWSLSKGETLVIDGTMLLELYPPTPIS